MEKDGTMVELIREETSRKKGAQTHFAKGQNTTPAGPYATDSEYSYS